MSWLVRSMFFLTIALVLLPFSGPGHISLASPLSAEEESEFSNQVDSETLEAGDSADYETDFADGTFGSAEDTPIPSQPSRGPGAPPSRGPASIPSTQAVVPPVKFKVQGTTPTRAQFEQKTKTSVAPDEGFQVSLRKPNAQPQNNETSNKPSISCDLMRKANSRYWHPACLRKSKAKVVETTSGHPDISPSEYYKRQGKLKGEQFNIKLRSVAATKPAAKPTAPIPAAVIQKSTSKPTQKSTPRVVASAVSPLKQSQKANVKKGKGVRVASAKK